MEEPPHVTAPAPFALGSSQRLIALLALACVPAWALAFVLARAGLSWGHPSARVVPLLYGATPAFAALFLSLGLLRERDPGALGLALRVDRWLAAAWLTAPLAVLGAASLAWCWPGAEAATSPADFWEYYRARVPDAARGAFEREAAASITSGSHPAVRFALAGLVGGVIPGAILKLGTELAWRGVAFRALEGARTSTRALVTAGMEFVWVLPLALLGYFTTDAPALVAAALLPNVVARAFLLDALRRRTGTLLAGAVLLGTVEALGPLVAITTRGAPAWAASMHGAAGAIVFAAMAALMALVPARTAGVADE